MQRERQVVSIAAIANLAARGADPVQIALLSVAIWRAIHADLAPIVGQRGVSALYERSLHTTAVNFPWLNAARDATRDTTPGFGEFEALREALSHQPGTVSAAANDALFTSFFELLSSLIGESLAGRLLSAVRDNTSGGPALRET